MRFFCLLRFRMADLDGQVVSFVRHLPSGDTPEMAVALSARRQGLYMAG
jgi:hypothetical protein